MTNAGSCAEQDFYVNFTYNKKNGSFSLEFQWSTIVQGTGMCTKHCKLYISYKKNFKKSKYQNKLFDQQCTCKIQ